MTAASTYYDVLGILPNATAGEIRKAYLRAAAASHPDKNPDAPKHVFQLVAEAYECLKDPVARNGYDLKLQAPRQPSPMPFIPPRPSMPFFQSAPPRPVHLRFPRPSARPFAFRPAFIPPRPPPPFIRPHPPPPFIVFTQPQRRSHFPAFPSARAEIEVVLRQQQAVLEAFMASRRFQNQSRPFSSMPDEDDGDHDLDGHGCYRERARPYNTSHMKEGGSHQSRRRGREPWRARPPDKAYASGLYTPAEDLSRTRATPENPSHLKGDYVHPVYAHAQEARSPDVVGQAESSRTRATPFNTSHLKQGDELTVDDTALVDETTVDRHSKKSASRSQSSAASTGSHATPVDEQMRQNDELAKRVQEVCEKWGVTEEELWERLELREAASSSLTEQHGGALRHEQSYKEPAPIPLRKGIADPQAGVQPVLQADYTRPSSPTPSWETAFTRFPDDGEPIGLPSVPLEPPLNRRSAPRSLHHPTPKRHHTAPPRPQYTRGQQSAPEHRHIHGSLPQQSSSHTMLPALSHSNQAKTSHDEAELDDWGIPIPPLSSAELNRDLPPLPNQDHPPTARGANIGSYLTSMNRRLSKGFLSKKR